MAFNIGVNLVETDGRAAPAIVAAPTSETGFLLRSRRGVPNTPVTIFGFTDFVANFGAFTETELGAYTVNGFFQNGGAVAKVVRIVGAGSVPARATLRDRTGLDTLTVTAAMRGQADPGAWGNELAVTIVDHPRGASALPDQVSGTAAEPFALTDGATLVVTADGASTAETITFTAGDFAAIGAASAADVATVINRQSVAFRAAATPGGVLLLATVSAGPAAQLQIAGTAATALGFTGGAVNSTAGLPAGATLAALQSTGGLLPSSAVRLETRGHVIAPNAMGGTVTAGAGIRVTADGGSGVDVIFTAADFAGGLGATTPAEVVAAINRQANGFTAALTHDRRLVLFSNSFGPASTLTVDAPTGGAANAASNLGLDLTTNPPVAGTESYRTVLTRSEAGRFITWSGGLGAGGAPTAVARVQSLEFDLIVMRNGVEVERFESLSMQAALDYYAPAVVNDAESGSRYVMLTDLGSAAPAGQDIPAHGATALGTTTATAGVDTIPVEADFIGNAAQRTGLSAFDATSIQLLLCPESTAIGVVQALLDYCATRGDCMFIGAPPQGYDLESMKTYASLFRGRKVYGALYGPWVQIVNPLDTSSATPRRWIPPVGHIAGSYARITQARGIWKAPAGDEANLRGVIGVEFDMTDLEHTDLVKNGSINGVRAIPGSGIVVDASRTLSIDTRWLFVNVRRLFNFVKSSVRDSLRWVAQEPHDSALRQRVTFNVVRPFLLNLWRQGAFGTGDPETLFTIICDETNNPPADVQQGIFRLELYFYPVRPAETIILEIGQQEDSGSATET